MQTHARKNPSQVLDNLDGVAVRVGYSRHQQSPEPFVWGDEGGGTACAESGEDRGSVVGPEDDSRTLTLGNWIQAVVITRRGD